MFKSFLFAAVASLFLLPATFVQAAQVGTANGTRHHHHHHQLQQHHHHHHHHHNR